MKCREANATIAISNGKYSDKLHSLTPAVQAFTVKIHHDTSTKKNNPRFPRISFVRSAILKMTPVGMLPWIFNPLKPTERQYLSHLSVYYSYSACSTYVNITFLIKQPSILVVLEPYIMWSGGKKKKEKENEKNNHYHCDIFEISYINRYTWHSWARENAV